MIEKIEKIMIVIVNVIIYVTVYLDTGNSKIFKRLTIKITNILKN